MIHKAFLGLHLEQTFLHILAEFFLFFIFYLFLYSEQGLKKTQYNAWIPIAKASIKEPRKKKNKN